MEINGLNFFLEKTDYLTLSKSAKVLQEECNTLYEDIYYKAGSKLNKRLEQVDELHNQLIMLVDKEEGTINNKSTAKNILKKITSIMNSMFNIEMDLYIDYKQRPDLYVAATTYDHRIIEKIQSEVAEIVINGDNGYHMMELTNITVMYQDSALSLLKYPELSQNGKNAGREFPKNISEFNGRHLTEILLHEIGHNVFIPFYYSQSRDGAIEIKVGNKKPIVVYPDKFGHRFNFNINDFVNFICVLLMCLQPVYVPYAFLSSVYLLLIKNSVNNYMRNEKNANTLPFQYGYAKEVFESTVRIKWITDGGSRGFRFSALKRLFKSNKSEYQSIITGDLLTMLDVEIKNPNNGKEQLAYLNQVKKYYLGTIRDMQTSMDIYAKNHNKFEKEHSN